MSDALVTLSSPSQGMSSQEFQAWSIFVRHICPFAHLNRSGHGVVQVRRRGVVAQSLDTCRHASTVHASGAVSGSIRSAARTEAASSSRESVLECVRDDSIRSLTAARNLMPCPLLHTAPLGTTHLVSCNGWSKSHSGCPFLPMSLCGGLTIT